MRRFAFFIRNVLIAIGNSGDIALTVEAERLLDDQSPLVRGAAVWALSQLMGREAFEALAVSATKSEADDGVRAEWHSAVMPREGGHPVFQRT
jgi:epoxyqueuosine reductase